MLVDELKRVLKLVTRLVNLTSVPAKIKILRCSPLHERLCRPVNLPEHAAEPQDAVYVGRTFDENVFVEFFSCVVLTKRLLNPAQVVPVDRISISYSQNRKHNPLTESVSDVGKNVCSVAHFVKIINCYLQSKRNLKAL